MTDRKNRFERHPARTLTALGIAFLFIATCASEGALRVIGFGDPVLYQTDPAYGYRPRPNQDVRRFHGKSVRINNLGLRALSDWDADPRRKVLFLGNSVTYGGSSVSTDEIFAVRSIPPERGWLGASAGVNSWGVENIRGLVVGHSFLPARTVVLVLIEDDFYRGLTQLPSAFWTHKPRLALQEGILYAVPHLQELMRRAGFGSRPDSAAAATARRTTAARAVAALAETTAFLEAHNRRVRIYISPYRSHLERTSAADTTLYAMLHQAGLRPLYLKDRPELLRLRPAEIGLLYRDVAHLTSAGHALWAEMLRRDLQVFTDDWSE